LGGGELPPFYMGCKRGLDYEKKKIIRSLQRMGEDSPPMIWEKARNASRGGILGIGVWGVDGGESQIVATPWEPQKKKSNFVGFVRIKWGGDQ